MYLTLVFLRKINKTHIYRFVVGGVNKKKKRRRMKSFTSFALGIQILTVKLTVYSQESIYIYQALNFSYTQSFKPSLFLAISMA